MNTLRLGILGLTILLLAACGPAASDQDHAAGEARKTAAQTEVSADGVQVLFDGSDMDQFHGYLKEGIEGWAIVEGQLTTEGGNGDLVTNEEYENFELEFEFSISSGGNSGVMFHVTESDSFPATYLTGPEYQIIDDNNYHQELKPSTKTAANFDVHAPTELLSNEPGTYNQGKLVVNEGHVEHWLNGTKVLEYELWTPEWEELIATTKWEKVPSYGRSKTGRIAFQDHGDAVSFRNIRIKVL